MENKTFLVTGGAGFIGSHLCEKLLLEKNRVLCLDNFSTGKQENISDLFENQNFLFIKADITEELSIDEKIDFIFNLASPASPVDYQKRPIETLCAGSIGVKNVLELAKKNNAGFLQASTSEVYGDPQQHPQKESYYGNVNPVGPRACYDESKRFAEALTKNFGEVYGLETKIARIFNTYGPKMQIDDGRVIPNFITQALKEKRLTVFGDGSQTRSFCYVDDLIDGLLKLGNSSVSGPVNLGNSNEITILEVAKKIIKLSNSTSELEFFPLPKDDPVRRNPDISLAQKEINWSTFTELDEGLLKTIEFFKK